MPGSEPPLTGAGILITRPGSQAETLANMAAERGAVPVILPLIEVTTLGDSDPVRTAVAGLGDDDLAIFVSVHAVDAIVMALQHGRLALPDRLLVAAIGGATSSALSRAGINVDIQPVGSFDSEGLIRALDRWKTRIRRACLFRAESGRELLANWLREQGIHVDEVASYRRTRLKSDAIPALDALSSTDSPLLTATSAELLDALISRVPNDRRQWLLQLPIAVLSERIHRIARDRGFIGRIVVADNPSNSALLAALEKCLLTR